MSGGKGSNTSSSTFQLPPEIMKKWESVVGKGEGLANSPLTLYGGPSVAPFTPGQEQAFRTVDAAQGMSLPWLNEAGDMFRAAGAPINAQSVAPRLDRFGSEDMTRFFAPWQENVMSQVPQFSAEGIRKYMDPFLEDVVGAEEARMVEDERRQQQDLMGNAISKGAWGGDRAGIAQAELARQHKLARDPALARLRSEGYGQAVQQFGRDQALTAGLLGQGYGIAAGQYGDEAGRELSAMQGDQSADLTAQQASRQFANTAAGGLAGLGSRAQEDVLKAANAQLGTGGMQQELAQSFMNVPYQQFTQMQAYPWESNQYLANLLSSWSSAAGGTTSSSQPGPSPISQIAGLATAALPFFALSDKRTKKNIDKVGEKNGINIYDFEYKKAPGKKYRGVMAQEVKDIPGAVAKDEDGIMAVDYSKLPLAHGGRVPELSGSFIPKDGFKMASPNFPSAPRPYEEEPLPELLGGVADIFKEDGTEVGKQKEFVELPWLKGQPKQELPWLKEQTQGLPWRHTYADGGSIYDMEMNEAGVYGLPSNIPDAGADFIPLEASGPAPMAGSLPPAASSQPPAPSAPSPEQQEGLMAMLSKGGADPKMAMIMAGLGMASGQSPNAITNIARGGIMGLNSLAQQREALAEAEKEARKDAREQQRLDLQAQQLAEMVNYRTNMLDLKGRSLDIQAAKAAKSGAPKPPKPVKTKGSTIKDFRERVGIDYPDMVDQYTGTWVEEPEKGRMMEKAFIEQFRATNGDFESAYQSAMDSVMSAPAAGKAPAAAAPVADTVRVQYEGRTMIIPADRLDEALATGAKKVGK